jgi:glucan phosphoethanolaminetransferase (alkaline phosphatase superfamily)
MAEKKKLKPEETPGFVSRIVVSMLVFFGLLIFFIIWLFFYADSFTIFQNVAIILVALLASFAIWGACWISWGMKYGFDECRKSEKDSKSK